MKILIVEDELVIAGHMKEILEKEGHHVLPIVRNYSDAMNSFKQDNPNLVLLDLHLAENASGFKVAEKIKEGANTAIVIVASNTSKEFLNKAKELNPNGFLSKPVKPMDLILAVELGHNSFLKNAELGDDISQMSSLSLISEQSMILRSFIHDTMNPMTSIRYQLQRSKTLADAEKETIIERFDIVVDLLKSFRSLVKGRGEKPELIKIPTICKKIDLINQYRCMTNGIELLISPLDDEIMGTEGCLVRIFSNLINNSIDALKDTEIKEKWIEIVFTKVGDSIRAVVTDSGKGIAPEIEKSLFTKDFLNSNNDRSNGMGLGLYSAKESLNNFKHNIHYNSNSENTQFIITFNSRP